MNIRSKLLLLILFSLFSLVDAEEIEEIKVTGSYIGSRANDIGTQIIDQTDFKNLNVSTVGEISKYLASAAGAHFQSNTLDGVDQGMAAITLRGLDHASTLVLINQKRQTFAGTPSHEGEGYIDVNIIPEIALNRVEVLKEGATSLYGSDAVAGVINFITEDDFEGLKMNLSQQETTNYDQKDNVFGIIYGKRFNDSNLVIAANVLKRSALPSIEIPKIAENGLSTLGNTFKVSEADSVSSGDYIGSYSKGDWVADPNCLQNGGVIQGPFCKFLYGTRFNIVNDEDHEKFYLSYKKDIDNLSFNFKYIDASIDVNDNPQSPSYPALSFMSRKILPGQGGSPFNVPVTWYGRPLGSAFPSPISPKDIDQYHFSGSVNIELENQANLELSVTKSKHKNFHNRPDTINSRMEMAIAGKGGANGNETWNLFNPLLNSSSLIEYIKGSEQSLKIGELTSIDAILRTKLGTNNLAMGIQISEESLDVSYNELSRAEFDSDGDLIKSADLLFLGGGRNTFAKRDKEAIFFELEKIFSERIDLLFASRFEKVDDESSLDPKLTLNYRPIENLNIRASIGTSFSTPSMAQLFSSEIALGGVRDVINGIEQTTSLFVRVIQLGNPELEPASSINTNLGLSWSFDQNTSVSMDFWKIDYKDRLELEDAQTKILDNPSSLAIQRNEYGDIVAVKTTFFNEEKTIVKGLDLSVDYRKVFKSGQIFDLGINATHLLEYLTPEHDEEDDAGHSAKMINRVGRFNYNAHTHSLPRLRLNALMGLRIGDTRYSINARYLDSYENQRPLPESATNNGYTNNIDSFLVFDVGVTKDISVSGQIIELGLHLINAFDESAPLVYDAPDFSFDTRLHDPRGRLLNLSIDYEF
ncbi:MAG: TonB-dependent receptor [Gammaproteobacteria bacterium]|nr:TonB-dependent receptor [Gammaproteobacteria bacterium]OUT94343.1 MAG: TonB-dependent receptor [Gammaproteobacteria bacterium TMED36]